MLKLEPTECLDSALSGPAGELSHADPLNVIRLSRRQCARGSWRRSRWRRPPWHPTPSRRPII